MKENYFLKGVHFMYKVILRMLYEWVRITIGLPLLFLCFLGWSLMALLWKVAGFGTIKDFYIQTNVKSIADVINARMIWVKTGNYERSSQQ